MPMSGVTNPTCRRKAHHTSLHALARACCGTNFPSVLVGQREGVGKGLRFRLAVDSQCHDYCRGGVHCLVSPGVVVRGNVGLQWRKAELLPPDRQAMLQASDVVEMWRA